MSILDEVKNVEDRFLKDYKTRYNAFMNMKCEDNPALFEQEKHYLLEKTPYLRKCYVSNERIKRKDVKYIYKQLEPYGLKPFNKNSKFKKNKFHSSEVLDRYELSDTWLNILIAPFIILVLFGIAMLFNSIFSMLDLLTGPPIVYSHPGISLFFSVIGMVVDFSLIFKMFDIETINEEIKKLKKIMNKHEVKIPEYINQNDEIQLIDSNLFSFPDNMLDIKIARLLS